MSIRGISSSGRALPWHGRGEQFKSAILHQGKCIDQGVLFLFATSPESICRSPECFNLIQCASILFNLAYSCWLACVVLITSPPKYHFSSLYCSYAPSCQNCKSMQVFCASRASNRYQLVKHHLVDSCCHYTITNTLACIQMYGHSGIYLVYMLNCRCSEAHAREAMKFRSRYFSWYVRLAVDLTN